MYLTLLDATEKAINELISAQRACEELYISSSEEENNEEKAKNIKIVENKKDEHWDSGQWIANITVGDGVLDIPCRAQFPRPLALIFGCLSSSLVI